MARGLFEVMGDRIEFARIARDFNFGFVVNPVVIVGRLSRFCFALLGLIQPLAVARRQIEFVVIQFITA